MANKNANKKLANTSQLKWSCQVIDGQWYEQV